MDAIKKEPFGQQKKNAAIWSTFEKNDNQNIVKGFK